MIQNIFFIQNNSSLTFEGRYPNKIFHDVRDIPNLTCANCGEKMLPRLEAENFFTRIRPSLKKCLEKLDSLKSSKKYPVLAELANKYPKENIDQLLSNERQTNKGISAKQIPNSIIDKIRTVTFNAPTVIKKLQKYRKYMSDVNLELLDILTVYAKRYPKNTITEIITKPEVYNYHKQAVIMEKALLETKAKRVFKKMKKFTDKMDKDKKEELIIINSTASKIVKNTTSTINAKQYLEDLYEPFIAKIENPKDKEIFRNLIQELPQAQSNPDRMILKSAQNGSSYGLIYHMFDKKSTFEHIKPKSQNGTNLQMNGICLCADCNEKRGTIPYKKLFMTSADLGKNIQKQLSAVMRYILRGQLVRYDLYPQKVKKTLYEESGHVFKLDIKKYLMAQIKKSQDKIKDEEEYSKKNNEQLNNVKTKLQKLIQQQRALEKKQAKNEQNLNYELAKLKNYEQSMLDEENF